MCFILDHNPIIFITSRVLCTCGGELSTYCKPAFLTLYTSAGMTKATSYHKNCKVCEAKFYFSYKECNDGTKIFHNPEEHFMISNRTGFQVLLLRTMCDLVETTGITFTGFTQSYNKTHSSSMQPQRLEEGYFMYRLLFAYESCGQQLTVPYRGIDSGGRINLEDMCQKIMEMLPDSTLHTHHKCDYPGCGGFIMADGIEKVCQLFSLMTTCQ